MDGHVTVVAVDVSPDALDLARENAVGHGVADRMVFREGDLLPGGEPPYAVICANLPYVATAAMDGSGPRTSRSSRASRSTADRTGWTSIRRLLDRLPLVLDGDGVALLEIGADQGEAVVAAAAEILPGWRCTVRPDLAGLPRLARVEPPPPARGARAGAATGTAHP